MTGQLIACYSIRILDLTPFIPYLESFSLYHFYKIL